MSEGLILLLIAVYMAALFAVAFRADRRGESASPLRRGLTYGLSLAVYCTSWTFFGAVGTAAKSGWEFLPIYLGPVLALLVLFPLWRRIAAAAKRENVGSIADFLSSRYGKSRPLGALVALVCVVGALPYVALQLKSLAMSWTLVVEGEPSGRPADLTVLLIAAGLAGFAILFGARRADLTEQNRGLVQAVAFESLVKLAALLAAAAFAVVLLAGVPSADLARGLGALSAPPEIDARFVTITLLATAAILCLPRQFHMGFVELGRPEDLKAARTVFPAYLVLTSAAVLPIVAAGALLLPASYDNPDLYVLDLPIEFGGSALTALVFIGGFSAATAMVIVETVALSAMASNELILPLFARRWRERADAGRTIVTVRRLVIVGVLVLAWLYFQLMDRNAGLAQIGLTSFACAAQLLPALVGAVVWRRGHAAGAVAGLAAGFLVWLWTLALPQVVGELAAPAFLAPHALFGLGGLDPLVHGVLWSLGLNTALYVVVSMRARPRLIDRVQATAFVHTDLTDSAAQARGPLSGTVADLKGLLARFLGDAGAQRAFADYEAELGRPLKPIDPVDAALARAAERMLAGAVGASSARGVIATALSGQGDPDEVVRLLDEAAQAVQFNRELLQAALDNLSQGVSVVDADLRLVAWNRRYLELFRYPPGFVFVGRPVADLIRYNAEKGDCGPGEVEAHVARRLEHLRRARPHRFERVRRDGRILLSQGAPMPGGGYVTTFTDVTEDRAIENALRQAARALEDANEQLEDRVEARTAELADAKALAERATDSKTRFLAAASHDLLQPLHAARLFIGALAEDASDGAARELARNADRAIGSADRLLRALLNLSKLEAGGVKPEPRALAVGPLIEEMCREFEPLAAEKGLTLTAVACSLWVRSDRDLLRSVLQNLIGNAIRYTDRGGVVVGCRRAGPDALRFEVWDTGRGIPEAERAAIFKEFRRHGAQVDGDPGMGLGLAIVDRVAELLGHEVDLASRVGRGTVFRVRAPRVRPEAAPIAPTARRGGAALAGLRVLCVDNEPAILESLAALLGRWGARAETAASIEQALAHEGGFDAALIDYRLDAGETGLELLRRLGARAGRAALVTADATEALGEDAAALGAVVIRKPVEPAALKAFLSSARAGRAA